MQGTCLNCQVRPSTQGEYCIECDKAINSMIDSSELESDFRYLNVNRNIFFQTSEIEGDLLSDDPSLVANQVKLDDKDDSGFWRNLFILVILLIAMVAYFL